MYRILAESGEVRERRDQLEHPRYAKPELVATAPKQVWSWDITKGDVPRAVENGRRSGGELKIHELGFEVNDSA
jgi:putative transposase